MARMQAKRFESADEVRPFQQGKGQIELIELAGSTLSRGTFESGWRWSEHVKPISGTDSCEVEHLAYVMQGKMNVVMDDGEEVEVNAGDFVHIPPGHDAWIVGDEACVMLDFGGMSNYAKPGSATTAP